MKIIFYAIVIIIFQITSSSIWDNYYSHAESKIKVFANHNQLLLFYIAPNNTISDYFKSIGASEKDRALIKIPNEILENYKKIQKEIVKYLFDSSNSFSFEISLLATVFYGNLVNKVFINFYKSLDPEYYLDKIVNASKVDYIQKPNFLSEIYNKNNTNFTDDQLIEISKNSIIDEYEQSIGIDLVQGVIVTSNPRNGCFVIKRQELKIFDSIDLFSSSIDFLTYYNKISENMFEIILTDLGIYFSSSKNNEDNTKFFKLIDILKKNGLIKLDSKDLLSLFNNFSYDELTINFVFLNDEFNYFCHSAKIIYKNKEIAEIGLICNPLRWFDSNIYVEYFYSRKDCFVLRDDAEFLQEQAKRPSYEKVIELIEFILDRLIN